jgi:hypothetical protein
MHFWNNWWNYLSVINNWWITVDHGGWFFLWRLAAALCFETTTKAIDLVVLVGPVRMPRHGL